MNSRLKYFLGGCLIMSLLVIATVPARADYTIEQNNETGTMGNVYLGQTFTTDGYGRITQIDVYVSGENTTCDSLQLCIFDGSQEPSDPDAAQYCETFSGFTDFSYAFWKSLELTVPFPVDSNTQYTFGLVNTGSGSFQLRATSADAYDGGHIWPYYEDPTFRDLAFRVHIEEVEWVDLAITKTDNQTDASPGDSVTYTIIVTNSGPADVTGASVSDTFPSQLTGAIYTASQTGGASGFTAAGNDDINDTVNMPAGSQITYTVQATIDAAATSTLSNTATVSVPSDVTDPDNANNTATDDTQLNVNSIPTVNAWGIVSIVVLFGAVAIRTMRRRNRSAQ